MKKLWIFLVTLVLLFKKNSVKEKSIFYYLLSNLKKEALEDLPCYTSPDVQDDFRKKIYTAADCGHTAIVKILAPLTDNPNAPNNDGETPIYLTTSNGHGHGRREIQNILQKYT